MTEDARRLLSLLGVLPEGFRRDRLGAFFTDATSAAAVLLQVGLALEDAGRLRALAPVREYVREKHGVTREDLQHAVQYYLGWAQETQQALKANTLEFSQHVAQELGNLEALVVAGLTPPVGDSDSSADTSEKIRSILSLGTLLASSGLGVRAPRIVGKALQRAEDIKNERLQLDCLILLGEIASVHDNLEEARRHFTASVRLSRQIGDDVLAAVGISKLGVVDLGYSDLLAARGHFEEAEALFARKGKTEEQGRCLLELAKIHFAKGELAAAEAKAQEAKELLRRKSNAWGEANCLNFLGEIALETKHPALAKQRIAAAQEIYERLASPLGRANCLKNLGRVALQRSDDPSAVSSFDAASNLYRLIGNRQGEADCLQGLGDLQQRSEPEAARVRYREALGIYLSVGDPLFLGWIHVRLGRVATEAKERRDHIEAARVAWGRIGRSDLVEGLRQEFG
jgi:tetratricopeptide (TPR) repeat protein